MVLIVIVSVDLVMILVVFATVLIVVTVVLCHVSIVILAFVVVLIVVFVVFVMILIKSLSPYRGSYRDFDYEPCPYRGLIRNYYRGPCLHPYRVSYIGSCFPCHGLYREPYNFVVVLVVFDMSLIKKYSRDMTLFDVSLATSLFGKFRGLLFAVVGEKRVEWVLPTPSLHIEMVTYCTSYTNNTTLRSQFETYFPSKHDEFLWVRDPFHCDVENNKLSLSEREQLIELLNNTGLKIKFEAEVGYLTTLYELRGYLASMRLVIARWYLARWARGFAIDYLVFTLQLGKTSEKTQPGEMAALCEDSNEPPGSLKAKGVQSIRRCPDDTIPFVAPRTVGHHVRYRELRLQQRPLVPLGLPQCLRGSDIPKPSYYDISLVQPVECRLSIVEYRIQILVIRYLVKRNACVRFSLKFLDSRLDDKSFSTE
ncbi:hypothetical protein ANN_04281 [Periplaneta americana]|uniref:Uncharacterized protein n=1 Tax=Periplaneta americana TaxID=6978 RepID=A0ABQ8T848_PERAM|nr:hypothetical protein ANN_04281 [Periplaneta americana]